MADDAAFERKLYVIRKVAHTAIRAAQADSYWYAPSLSCRTLVYKGMLTPEQVGQYFTDLRDPDMQSALALVHSRFSTNTFPSWERAHPYRYIAHNGEINTLRGNINWMHARQSLLASPLFDDIKKIFPIVNQNGSDSAMFDNVLELLVLGGRSLPHAMMMMIPEPWNGHESMSDEKKAFYEYHSCLMEPWDGPASIAFTDGTMIGATLDRNGLRPSRYYVTKDDLVIMASEAGVLPIEPDRIAHKGRLAAGPHVPREHGGGPHHRRRRDQGDDRRGKALPAVAGQASRAARQGEGRPGAAAARSQDRAAAADGVRLHF